MSAAPQEAAVEALHVTHAEGGACEEASAFSSSPTPPHHQLHRRAASPGRAREADSPIGSNEPSGDASELGEWLRRKAGVPAADVCDLMRVLADSEGITSLAQLRCERLSKGGTIIQ